MTADERAQTVRTPWVVRCENPACDWDAYKYTETVSGWPVTNIEAQEPFFCPRCGCPAVNGAGVYRITRSRRIHRS